MKVFTARELHTRAQFNSCAVNTPLRCRPKSHNVTFRANADPSAVTRPTAASFHGSRLDALYAGQRCLALLCTVIIAVGRHRFVTVPHRGRQSVPIGPITLLYGL